MKKTFCMHNDDVCIRLRLFGEEIRALLIENEWIECKQDSAEFLFINTCAFLRKAEDKAISKIKNLNLAKPNSQNIIVFGCLPRINPERLKLAHDGEIIMVRDISEFMAKFGFKKKPCAIGHVVEDRKEFLPKIYRTLNRLLLHDPYLTYLYDKEKVYHLKISQGCLGNCSYCSEKFARGKLSSKPIHEIITEFEKGLSKGYRIFSLSSDDTGVFGWDRGENISQLLEKLLSYNEEFKIVLTEFNPHGLLKHEKELLPLLKSSKLIFITIPIQSGSDRILRLMNRSYQVSHVELALDQIRSVNPSIKINTHIIAGFPGETQSDYQKTYDMLDSFSFNKAKVFGYSDQPGTESSKLPGKLSIGIIDQRVKELKRLMLVKRLLDLDFVGILLNLDTM
ncbi:MAG: radical SAM protein [Candidatus Woesearchaeota archaeon]